MLPQASPCADQDRVVEILTGQKFKERVVGMGLAAGGTKVAELYSNDKGDWTLVLTLPEGLSCMIASGTKWQEVTEPDL